MVAMAKRLKERGIPFYWFVYSTGTENYDLSNFILMQPELNIRDYIANADYLVQLSDTERLCIFISRKSRYRNTSDSNRLTNIKRNES